MAWRCTTWSNYREGVKSLIETICSDKRKSSSVGLLKLHRGEPRHDVLLSLTLSAVPVSGHSPFTITIYVTAMRTFILTASYSVYSQ